MPERVQQLIEEVVRVITRLLKERLGRGPQGYRTYLIDDMIMIRLINTMTLAEYEMAKNTDGLRSVKDTRTRLIEELRPVFEGLVTQFGANLISVHSDLSTRTGERIVVLVLDRKARQLQGEAAADP